MNFYLPRFEPQQPFKHKIKCNILILCAFTFVFVLGFWSGSGCIASLNGRGVKMFLSNNRALQTSSYSGTISVKQKSKPSLASPYLDSEWKEFPPQLVREALGFNVTPLLFPSPTGYSNVSEELARKKFPLNENEFKSAIAILQKALKQWASLVGATAIPQESGVWKIRGNSTQMQGIRHDLDSDLARVLGQERAHIFHCMTFSSLNRFFKIDAGTITLEGNNSATLSLSPESHTSLTFDLADIDSHCPMAALRTVISR